MECPLLLTLDEPIEVLDEASSPILQNQQDFLKSLLFSSDGRAVLTSTESKQALIYRIDDASLQKHQYYVSQGSISSKVCSQDDNLNANLSSSSIAACPSLSLEKTISIGESIYDLKWSPNSNTATSQRFLATSSDHPIQLWDVETASVFCSYNAYNHLDELDTAVSLALNATSDRVYGGYNRMIRLGTTNQPTILFNRIALDHLCMHALRDDLVVVGHLTSSTQERSAPSRCLPPTPAGRLTVRRASCPHWPSIRTSPAHMLRDPLRTV